MKTMNSLLLLLAMLATVHSARPKCTAKDMEGLQVVGYALERVFRLTDYSDVIDLDDKFYDQVSYRRYMKMDDFLELVQLHQGFDHKLFVLHYGGRRAEPRVEMRDGRSIETDSWDLEERWSHYPFSRLSVLNITSLYPKERDEWEPIDKDIGNIDEPDFASFVYEDRIYYAGGFTTGELIQRTGSESYFKFFPGARDLCVGLKNPVVDIASKPPFCHNRLLNESAAVEPNDDEWIVSLVNGIRTTRSRTRCKDISAGNGRHRIVDDGIMYLPDEDAYCFYLQRPHMLEPCWFAYGTRHIFEDVQLAPVEPVLRAEFTTTTSAPVTTSTDSSTINSDAETKSSEMMTTSLASGWTLSPNVVRGLSVLLTFVSVACAIL